MARIVNVNYAAFLKEDDEFVDPDDIVMVFDPNLISERQKSTCPW